MFNVDVDLRSMREQLAAHFKLDELRTLCFDLGIQYENVPGDTLDAKARELVIYCYKYARIPDLLAYCQEKRPTVVWDQPGRVYRADELPDDWVEPLQRLHHLVRQFNRNRHLPLSDARTRQGDDIAFEMREAAPFLFNQFDVEHWLNSSNIGKRLAAVKYLDWLQDIEHLQNLLGKLASESPFVQLHVLVTIDSMLDQLDEQDQVFVKTVLTAFKLTRVGADREFWRKRILSRLGT